MTAPRSVLIVGESLAGTTVARHLRTLGHAGPVTLIGAEEQGAYSRPPLSNVVLKDPAADHGVMVEGDPDDRRQQVQHGYQRRPHRTGRHDHCLARHCRFFRPSLDWEIQLRPDGEVIAADPCRALRQAHIEVQAPVFV
ncbi:FAD-dependent oxidoreductase [Streptomyces scabiei]|uniref:FAD-dependent oxidoreductase n=1 Tax=Streptomyces scabiei TaxID=1930 RepID=UPI0039F69A7A